MPETKGLTLEQVDKMLEETTPRSSARWTPHSTYAAEMGHAAKERKSEVEDEDEKGSEENKEDWAQSKEGLFLPLQ